MIKIDMVEIRTEWLREQYRFLRDELKFLGELPKEKLSEESQKTIIELIETIKKQMREVVLNAENNKQNV